MSLAVDDHISCAVHADGRVVCRGMGVPPAYVPGIERAIDVAVAGSEACALTQGGDLWCWRHALRPTPQRLGGPGSAARLTPGDTRLIVWSDGSVTTGSDMRVPGITDAVAAASGSGFACALHRSGRVSCWSRAQAIGREAVRTVPDLSDARAIAAGGEQLCVLGSRDEVKCWIVERSDMPEFRAREVPWGSSPASQVVVGAGHVCVLVSEEVLCWGNVPWPPPATLISDGAEHRIDGLPAIAGLYGGPRQTCARGRDGSMWCWGWAREGQLGDGMASTQAHTPGSQHLPGVRTLVATTDSSCALLQDGSVLCWGTEQAWDHPTSVGWVDDAIELAAQDDTLCARTATGEVKCRETRFSGMTTRRRPDDLWRAPVPPVYGAMSVTVGSKRACAVLTGGLGRCWSKYADHDRDFDGFAIPGAVEVAANLSDPLYVRTSAGRVHCIGRSSECVETSGLTDVEAIAVGECHLCALDRSGELRCGGCNVLGQTGSGTRTLERQPMQVVPGRYAAVDTDFELTCAITRPEREVVCWGDKANEDPASLLPVSHLRRPALSIAVGSSHACAHMEGDEVVCWGGTNRHGQLGNRRAPLHPRPTRLFGPAASSTGPRHGPRGSGTAAVFGARFGGDLLAVRPAMQARKHWDT